MSTLNDIAHAPPKAGIGKTRLAGAALLTLLGGFAIIGPLVIAADPAEQDFAASLAPIGGDYLLGADHYGRSLLARLAHVANL